MTAANWISIAALAVSLIMAGFNLITGSKTQKRAEDNEKETSESRLREEQAQQTSLMLTLNNIEKQLQKIENTINTVQTDCRQNHDQLIVLEQSLKSMHKRIDEHENRLNALEAAVRTMDRGRSEAKA